MKSRHDDFLERAAQAEARATAVFDPELKARWLNVAACWREMAAQLDRQEKD